MIAGHEPPHGFRATWDDRGRLAIAKLHSKLASGMIDSDFAAVLMELKGDAADCDFAEVHIYGKLHLRLIESVEGPLPTDKHERALWKSVKRKLEAQGSVVRES